MVAHAHLATGVRLEKAEEKLKEAKAELEKADVKLKEADVKLEKADVKLKEAKAELNPDEDGPFCGYKGRVGVLSVL